MICDPRWQIDVPEIQGSAVEGSGAAYVQADGSVVIYTHGELTAAARDAVTAAILARLGCVGSWVLERRTSGTREPTVETWRRLTLGA